MPQKWTPPLVYPVPRGVTQAVPFAPPGQGETGNDLTESVAQVFARFQLTSDVTKDWSNQPIVDWTSAVFDPLNVGSDGTALTIPASLDGHVIAAVGQLYMTGVNGSGSEYSRCDVFDACSSVRRRGLMQPQWGPSDTGDMYVHLNTMWVANTNDFIRTNCDSGADTSSTLSSSASTYITLIDFGKAGQD
jgi:hypothetical protein